MVGSFRGDWNFPRARGGGVFKKFDLPPEFEPLLSVFNYLYNRGYNLRGVSKGEFPLFWGTSKRA